MGRNNCRWTLAGYFDHSWLVSFRSVTPRIASAVASLELTRFTQSLGRFTPKESGNAPEVAKGQKIAVGSCISCHKLGNAGGWESGGSSWQVLAERAVNSKDY